MSVSASRIVRLLVCVCVVCGVADLGGAPQRPDPRGPSNTTKSTILGRLPIDFIENRGQWPTPARFAARKGAIAAAFEPHAIRLQLGQGATTPLALVFEGASSDSMIAGEGERPGVYNYFVGNDPSKWQPRVPAYSSVIYRGMYDGVDVRVREGAERFEYDLLVAPGTDLSRVVIRAEGATRLEVGSEGQLLLHTPDGPLTQTPPETSEVLPNGTSRPIESRFRIIDEHRYGFEAPARDAALPLIVDPGLVWSSFSGGTGGETLSGIQMARDGSGDIFLSGITSSPNFSSTPISYATARQKSFVARVSATGNALVYLTFISGLAGQTFAGDMAGDTAGGVILVGATADRDLPTTAGAYQRNSANTNLEALDGDGFVTRLDRFGAVVFSTYLGGSVNDIASEVRFDPSGSIIVAGSTDSPNFPVTAGAYDTTFNAPPAGDFTAQGTDTFISRLSADGSQLTYSTFFGGQTYDIPSDMVVDANGFVTLGGTTTSSETGRDMPVTADAFDSTWNGGQDGFVARFKLDGLGAADLKYSTFLGGINTEFQDGMAIDPTNPELVTVAGWSWVDVFTEPRFPTTPGVLKPVLTPEPPATPLFPHSQTGFVTRFRFPAGGGGSLVWSTFTGGNFSDIVTDVAVDEAGAAIVIGATRSYDLPTTRGAVDRTISGAPSAAYDCFVQKISADGAQLLYSTHLGGRGEDCNLTGFDEGRLVYVGGNTVAVAGMTYSPDFPTTPGTMLPVVDEVSNPRNLFVAKLHLAADASGDLSADPPTLLSPPNGALTDWGSVVRFRWSDVPDPSGIEAYVLEASSRSDFASNFTQFKVSTSSSELLLEGFATTIPWYWRVRTADRAGNLSDWSATSTFTTGLSGALPSVSMVQIYPTNIVGGQSPAGVLHLTKPAPAGGAIVTLSAKDGRGFTQTTVPLAVPETVTVPAGAISANFTISTSPVSIPTPVRIYGTIAGIGSWGGISVNPPASVTPASLSLNPLTVTGGNPVTGTVTLTGPAPAGGRVVPLGSQYPEFVSVPASITIPAGATSATFSIATSPVPIALNATIEAVGAPAASLSLKTPGGVRMTNLTLSATTATGGANVTGTVTFSGPIAATPAPATSGAIVKLMTSSPAVGSGPMIVVPAGASSMTFSLFVQNVPTTTSVNVVASYDDTTLTRTLTVTGSSVSLSSVTVNVNTLTGGQGGVGHVNLTGPAPAGHVLVTLSASDPAISLPPNVTISSGTTSGLFSFGAFPVATTTPATITAAFGSSTASVGVTVNPGFNGTVTSLALSPSTVVAGTSSTGTVTLSVPAPANGAVVQLSTVSPATVPPTVTVPAGATSASFNIGTTSTSSTAQPKIYAVLNTTWGAVLTVTPGTSGPTLSALSLSPTSVVGGNTSQGTVTLTGAAPSGGAVVSLSSSNTAVATVPSSVIVAAGSTSRTFTVTTSAVTTSTPVTISGSSGASRTATLTVTPPAVPTPAAPSLLSPASGATVALPVLLDWTDVSAAASYRIQIDDSSSFSAPRVVDQTVTASQFSAGSLAIRQHWWRVRGINSAGTAGAWSSVRSFTPQTAPVAPALSAITLSPSSVVGGNASQGTATLNTVAPSGGAVVTLTSSNGALASVPASVTVAAGATSATFAITTSAVTTASAATISGAYGGATRTATLTVNPVAAAPSLSGVTVSPSSVTGGSSSTGTVTLTSAAPTGGAVVTLSDNSTAATVPTSVTVLAGATSATFTVTTSTVTASTPVTITGSLDGATRTATLTVNPAGAAVTLTVTASGRSGERVTSNPAGINVAVGSTGSASFTGGTAITLSVSNGRDAIWSGACSSGGNKTRTCTFTISGNVSVTGNVQ
jgi:hypothetical protein